LYTHRLRRIGVVAIGRAFSCDLALGGLSVHGTAGVSEGALFMKVIPDSAGPGQESVWSFPRPAVVEPSQRRLKIVYRYVIIACTQKGIRTLETSHPPTYYFPLADIAPLVLRPSGRRSFCEWKGEAIYFDVVVRDETLRDVAWSYPDPNPAFRSLRDHVAFYARPFDGCFVDDERVTPQPGNFYGGWISSEFAGPFKGAPGTSLW
jgi:uncharacterized protein (DUF427 family)